MSAMKTIVRGLALVVVVGGAAALSWQAPTVRADDAAEPVTSSVTELLSGIDYTPPRSVLDPALGKNPLESLIAIAGAGPSEVDGGVRLRAYRALAMYPEDTARAALVAAINRHKELAKPVDRVAMRAALQALAAIGGPDAVPVIAAELFEDRDADIRVAAARALETVRSTTALPYLEDRLPVEGVPHVLLEIQKAIRTLSDLPQE
jgi:HEAT repeat protein